MLKRQLSGLFNEEEEKERPGVDPSKYIEPKIESMLSDRKKVQMMLNSNWPR